MKVPQLVSNLLSTSASIPTVGETFMSSTRTVTAAGWAVAKDGASRASTSGTFNYAAEMIQGLGGSVPGAVGQAGSWVLGNPGSAACIAAGTAGVVALAAPVVIAGPILLMAGFGPHGIVANSIAAGVQGTIGNVIAGSGFATLQSAGMAGYGVAAVNGVVQAAGGITAAVAGGAAAVQAKLKL